MAAVEVDPQEFTGTIVVAYGDANALRRGVAHAVLRDVLLHGALDPGVPLEEDPAAWVEAFATLRGAWLAQAFGVPAEAAAKHLSTPLRAVINSAGRELELVLDEEACVDCAVAQQVVAHVAAAAGTTLIGAPELVPIAELEAWRDAQLTELPTWIDAALTGAAAGDANLAQAWDLLAEASTGTGLADLGGCVLLGDRLHEPDAPAQLVTPMSTVEIVRACATSTLHEVAITTR